jgi:hypothetical protein
MVSKEDLKPASNYKERNVHKKGQESKEQR